MGTEARRRGGVGWAEEGGAREDRRRLREAGEGRKGRCEVECRLKGGGFGVESICHCNERRRVSLLCHSSTSEASRILFQQQKCEKEDEKGEGRKGDHKIL